MQGSDDDNCPVTYVTESCCICDEEFSSDSELAGHLINHANDEVYKKCLEDLENKQKIRKPISVKSRPRKVYPEYTKTSFVDDPKGLLKSPSSPEVCVLSDDSEDESKKTKRQKLPNNFEAEHKQGKPQYIPVSSLNRRLPYVCPDCDSQFYDVKLFSKHIVTHGKSKPYSCHICNKSFAHKGTLRQHLHLHIGDKKHECKMCHKKFSMKSILRKHEAVCMQVMHV